MQFGKPGSVQQNSNSGGYSTTILTPTVTKTSGNTSIDSISAVRFGNVVQVLFGFKFTGTVNAGSDAFVGTISDVPLPALDAHGVGYFSNSALVTKIETDGTMTIRIVGGNRSSSNTVALVAVTYVCS